MSEEIRGLIGVLRKGRLYCSSFDRARIRTAFAMPEGTNMAPLVGTPSERSFVPPLVLVQDSEDKSASLEGRSPISLSPRSEDETVAVTRKRRRSSRAALPGSSRPRLFPKAMVLCLQLKVT